jgi:formylglycine-generating enzyme required for sulfatase activity
MMARQQGIAMRMPAMIVFQWSPVELAKSAGVCETRAAEEKVMTCQLICLLALVGVTSVARGQEVAPPEFPFDAQAAGKYQRDFAASRNWPLEVKDRLGNEYVLIPPGTFWMGSPPDEPGRQRAERRHEVTISQPIYLAKRETTRGPCM